jgi:Flp pilus assembly protein TadG
VSHATGEPAELPARASKSAEHGAVTAELAMAVPLLLAVTVGLVWLLTLGTAQVLMVDAAREAARAAARGDSAEAALARGRQVAPAGAVLTLTTLDDRVVVSGTVEVDGVGGMLEVLPSVELAAEAVSAREEAPP